MTFAEAEGAVPLPSQLALGEVTEGLRARLWRALHYQLQDGRHYNSSNFDDRWEKITSDIFVEHLERMADDYDSNFYTWEDILRPIFEHGSYIDIFGLLQAIMRHDHCPRDFSVRIDNELITSRAAYRVFDHDTIAPIGSEAEAETLRQAFIDLTAVEFGGARAHLRNAASELTAGNYANSVRESIHAVESVARIIEPSAALSKALTKLEQSAKIHGALKTGFGSIYGYTSDEKGIRHPLLDGSAAAVDEADALFMIGACASFVTYLINKARNAGLIK